jgi:hypothetical protein
MLYVIVGHGGRFEDGMCALCYEGVIFYEELEMPWREWPDIYFNIIFRNPHLEQTSSSTILYHNAGEHIYSGYSLPQIVHAIILSRIEARTGASRYTHDSVR